jgi:plastocyanin
MSKRDVEISPDTRGIRYVLVWLEGVKLPDGYKPPTQTLILDNTKCQFEPHAAAITVGSTIETRNSDEVYHTTNLKGTKGVTTENIPLVSKGTSFKTKVRAAELIGVSCDKHGWMQAFIRVDPHPFHAVTDADGKFSIAGVPVGTYKLKAFHEKFYGQDLEVTVAEDEAVTLEIKYPTEVQK